MTNVLYLRLAFLLCNRAVTSYISHLTFHISHVCRASTSNDNEHACAKRHSKTKSRQVLLHCDMFVVRCPCVFILTHSHFRTTEFSDENPLQAAVKECLKLAPQGNCSAGTYGICAEWDVSRVTDMNRTFATEIFFNANISKWDVGRVTSMREMFLKATVFNAEIGNWDVSNVLDMRRMFGQAHSFNADISGWDVRRVTNMQKMFSNAISFNANISKWNVSNVEQMSSMFRNATKFDGDLSSWATSDATDMTTMLVETKLSGIVCAILLCAHKVLLAHSIKPGKRFSARSRRAE